VVGGHKPLFWGGRLHALYKVRILDAVDARSSTGWVCSDREMGRVLATGGSAIGWQRRCWEGALVRIANATVAKVIDV
jgi:hypothetical protein